MTDPAADVCPRCHNAGGRPWTWYDQDRRQHDDWQWCNCPAADAAIAASLTPHRPDNADRASSFHRRP